MTEKAALYLQFEKNLLRGFKKNWKKQNATMTKQLINLMKLQIKLWDKGIDLDAIIND